MKRSLSLMLVVVLVMMLSATAAFATSPKLNKADASVNNQGSLVVSFFITGLGNNENVNATVSWTGAAIEYTCSTRGNDKTVVPLSGTANAGSATQDFNSGKNGNIKGSITVPAAGVSCTPGHNLDIVSVTWFGVALTIVGVDTDVNLYRFFGDVS
jgi:hypothetical protein